MFEKDVQMIVILWLKDQPAITGIVLLAAGILVAFRGFRFFQLTLAATGFGAGYCIGALAGANLPAGANLVALGSGIVFGLASLKWIKPAVLFGTAATFAALAYYVCEQSGVRPNTLLLGSGVGAALGLFFARLCFDANTIILTTLQGSVLLVVGFIGTTDRLLPSLADSFLDLAVSVPLLIPLMILILFTTGFSFQSMRAAGDIMTGPAGAGRKLANPFRRDIDQERQARLQKAREMRVKSSQADS